MIFSAGDLLVRLAARAGLKPKLSRQKSPNKNQLIQWLTIMPLEYCKACNIMRL
jgi:hypothetical protein